MRLGSLPQVIDNTDQWARRRLMANASQNPIAYPIWVWEPTKQGQARGRSVTAPSRPLVTQNLRVALCTLLQRCYIGREIRRIVALGSS
jgi:hypothetical protein